VGSLFNLVTISFVVQKLFNFMLSHLSILSLSCWAIWVTFRKSLHMPINSSVFPALSYTNFKDSGLILRSLIHFELTLVLGDRYGFDFSFVNADIQLSQQHFSKRLSFLHHMFWAPLSKISLV
jgi:hypothetical protein